MRKGKIIKEAEEKSADIKSELKALRRQLEVEATLEKVRARTMAMRKSEELPEVALVLWKQLEHLKLNGLDGCAIHVNNDETGTFEGWSAFPELIDGRIKMMLDKNIHHQRCIWVWKQWDKHYRAGEISFTVKCNKKQLTELIDWFAPFLPGFAREMRDLNLDKLYVNGLAFSNGVLGSSSLEPLSEETWSVFKRLGSVFDQAYRRFEDLKKAEEQAREAEIELALERVRARAMAMHKSEELAESAELLYRQLGELGIDPWTCGYVFIEEEEDQAKVWQTEPNGKFFWGLWTLPLKEEKVLKDRYNSWKRREKIHRSILKGQDNIDHHKYITRYSPLSFEELLPHLPKDLVITSAHFSHGYLLVIKKAPLTSEQENLLIRFAKVFELTYTRFLDLKKAEEQAQEARVEVALERVRARTMAMQHSNELADASLLLAQQVKGLGIETWGCAFHIYDEDSKSATEWFSNHEAALPTYKLEMEHIFLEYYRAGQKGESLYIKTFEGKSCEKHYQYLCSLPVVGEALLDMKANGIPFPTFQIDHVAYFKYGHLLFITFKPLPEAHEIFKRFAAVFEQTYTRFLDLKKAEEQAREAQIEAALERVRARALAMHSSDEILEVADVLREQMGLLGQPELAVSAVHIYAQGAETFDSWWAFIPRGKSKRKILTGTSTFSIKTSVLAQEFVHRYESKQGTYTIHASGKELKEWQQELAVLAPRQIKSYRNQLPEEQYFHFSDFSGGSLAMVSYQEPSQESKDLQKRSAAVFNLAYQRFLDLKNAEAKAREAQIEAALERVRSRTMGMQRSEELQDAAMLMFQQVEVLGVPVFACGFNIWDPDRKATTAWMAGKDRFQPPFKTSSAEDIFHRIHKAAQKGASLFVEEQGGRALKTHYKYMNSIPVFKEITMKMATKGQSFPTYQITHCAYFSQGYLMFISFEPVIDAHDIFKRFAKVFEQTYTRFLDLKKAEEQAREAQIEAAMEKIRNRTLMMRDSSELNEAVAVFFQEFQILGLLPDEARTYFCHIDASVDMAEVWMTRADGTVMSGSHHTPLNRSASMAKYYKAWKEGKPIMERNYSGKALSDYLKFVSSLPHVKNDRDYQRIFRSSPKRIVMTDANFLQGNIGIMTFQPLSQNARDILIRFAKVFEFTYTRFLDLKKAEEQAREAQIEAALERVRAKAMAMHSSEDLVQTVGQLFKELNSLDISLLRCGVGRVHKDTRVLELYTFSRSKGDPVPVIGNAVLKGHPVLNGCFRHWEKQEEYHPVLKGASLRKYYEQIKTNYKLPGKQDSKVQYGYFFPFRVGVLFTYTETRFSEEELSIFRKFSSVVGLTYRRFLDLKEAEAQAREAQIEAALERVRARAMAMHKSSELAKTSVVLFDQFLSLGIEARRCGFALTNEEEKILEIWSTGRNEKKEAVLISGFLNFDQHPLITDMVDAWRNRRDMFTAELHGKALQKYYEATIRSNTFAGTSEISEKMIDNVLSTSTSEYYHLASFDKGMIYAFTEQPLNNAARKILIRFATAFELTYRRFLDLKKAEEQAVEAQIEAALERVRSAAAAMHSSEDLFSVAEVLHDQLAGLNQKELESSIIHIYPDHLPTIEVWYSYRVTDNSPKQISDRGVVPKNACSWTKKVMRLYNSGDTSYMIESKGKMLEAWYAVLEEVAPATIDYDKSGNIILPKILCYHFSKFSGGALLMISNEPPSEEARDMQRRAAKVFDLAYRRFLDLQKAEAQTREAQIEASLERVRASTMAMHSSEDVGKATNVLFQELENLGIKTMRCGIAIIKEDQTMEVWAASTFEGDVVFNIAGIIDMTIHPLLKKLYKEWKSGVNMFTYELKGKDAERYYSAIGRLPSYKLPDIEDIRQKHYSTGFLFKEGALFAFSKERFRDEHTQIFQKFTNVFTLTYRRYLDLKEAEARASAAVLKSSLDRVRAEIASMRNTDDLQHITPLVWRELRSLGVPFFRCGVFIMDESKRMVHMYLSTPTGKPLAAIDLGFDEKDIPLVRDAIDHWKTQTVHKTHWDRHQFRKFTESLKKRGLIKSLKTYQQGEKPPDSLNLHQVPFKQGMLYVGSSEVLGDDQIELVHSLAEAFSVAYARYQDFVKLEEAKKSIENTLVELKSAQNQLIHSEKMASLGELTAGIAHEIQNPLNFVNNFSEVSGELIAELKEEIEAGNFQDALEIGQDLIQNIEKINHHGQRASSIVKGMLQHSRASSDQKQLTDINALSDEYLRLAYHGFRAKDKSFNANYKTDLAEDLPEINVVPQDIGRVLLNLVNNAFQAVRGMENPEVIVRTQNKDEMVVISVVDNGPGIPADIKDKIFQPFFTTKAAGEGTGLGLSLSYDIVTKGHGGAIDVSSEVGKGTTIFVKLPY